MQKFHRWLATPAGVISIGLVAVALTGVLLGLTAAWMLAVLFAAIGVADYLLGKTVHTFSEEVNHQYHRRRRLFLLWAIAVGLVLGVGLYLHFTGV